MRPDLTDRIVELYRCPVSRQTLIEELYNRLTHRWAFVASIAAFVGMVTMAAIFGSALHIIATATFCITACTLFFVSMLYHSEDHLERKQLFRMLDHMAIFLLIAGTYTPYMLVLKDHSLAWPFFWTIWGVAVAGVVMKLFFAGRFRMVSTLLYLAMGWSGLLVIGPLQELLNAWGFGLLVGGGIAYTVGALFYLWRSLPFSHAIWHLFVMLGVTCHYFSVVSILVQQG